MQLMFKYKLMVSFMNIGNAANKYRLSVFIPDSSGFDYLFASNFKLEIIFVVGSAFSQ